MRPYSLKEVKTDSARSVRDYLARTAISIYGACNPNKIDPLFSIIESLYQGKHPDYQAADTAYHDLEHALQVTLCFARMVENYHVHHAKDFSGVHHFENGLAACLLHDTGYLRDNSDRGGTGAKFTLIHESRSCNVARKILGNLGWEEASIEAIQRMISSTGPRAVINAIPFKDSCEKTVAQMVATSDYMAQISDPEYLNKLPRLFEEFDEFDKTRGLAPSDRNFPDLKALIQQTPAFWKNYVLPHLENDCGGYYRYLAVPFPDGDNPYLSQAEANISAISLLSEEEIGA